MQNQVFKYTYSSQNNKEIEDIRRKYLPKREDKMETLRKLDFKVRSAGRLSSLILGISGSLIFGVGICFLLEVFSASAWISALFFVLGALMMIPAYPLCKYTAKRAKEKLSPKIIRLSDELMNL